jgi:hypothetical protein
LEGVDFSKDTQMKYQILLIKERIYTPTDIPQQHRTLFDDMTQEIPYDIAKKVFEYQNYVDPDMRGRQSVNPLNKLGFSIARAGFGRVRIIELGNRFLAGDYDISFIPFN